MSTALKFVIVGGDDDGKSYEFDELDVSQVVRRVIQNANIWDDNQGTYHSYLYGESYQKLIITFDFQYNGSLDSFDNLYQLSKDAYFQPGLIRCYYEYLINTSNFLYVQMKYDTYERNYYNGRDMTGPMTITFIETVPEGVAIINNKIIGI